MTSWLKHKLMFTLRKMLLKIEHLKPSVHLSDGLYSARQVKSRLTVNAIIIIIDLKSSVQGFPMKIKFLKDV